MRHIIIAQCARTVRTEAAQMLAQERESNLIQFKKNTRAISKPLYRQGGWVVLRPSRACGRRSAQRWLALCMREQRTEAAQ